MKPLIRKGAKLIFSPKAGTVVAGTVKRTEDSSVFVQDAFGTLWRVDMHTTRIINIKNAEVNKNGQGH